MEEVDWVKVGGFLDVHTVAKILEIKQQKCTEQEKSCSLTQYYVSTYPLASWEELATLLYKEGELRAVARAREYLPQGMCISRLHEIGLVL